jgi:hypothetical protein
VRFLQFFHDFFHVFLRFFLQFFCNFFYNSCAFWLQTRQVILRLFALT